MADVRKIRVMISSRSMTTVFNERCRLSDVRQRLQRFLQSIRWFADDQSPRSRLHRVGRDQALFDVWIHETDSGKAADRSTLEISLGEIGRADVVVVLYTGEAGSVEIGSGIGICHAEMREALARRPEIVSLVGLLPLQQSGSQHDAAFRKFVNQQSLYRKDVDSESALQAVVAELLQERVSALVARGAGIGARKRDRGQALDWNRLDIATRQVEMRNSLAFHLQARAVSSDRGDTLHIAPMPDEQLIGLRVDAIAAAASTAAARERVGQPFLRDHLYAALLRSEDVPGVVHVIACNRGITETQATRTLGTPDAMCVISDFGAYVADHVQRTQLVFLAQCADDTATALAVRRFNEWLVQSGECARIVQRAWTRRRILDVMAAEQFDGTARSESDSSAEQSKDPQNEELLTGDLPVLSESKTVTHEPATASARNPAQNVSAFAGTVSSAPTADTGSVFRRIAHRAMTALHRDATQPASSHSSVSQPEAFGRATEKEELEPVFRQQDDQALPRFPIQRRPASIHVEAEDETGEYVLPGVALLDAPKTDREIDERELMDRARLLQEKCREFSVEGTVVQIHPGPVVTTYEFKPDAGVKYSEITGLADDLCLAMQAESVLIDRIPGKSTVGIQIPNQTRERISIRELLESDTYRRSTSKLTIALGKTIDGEPYMADLSTMPHLLIAGSTGTGKSVGINSMLASILYRATPDDVRLILIDPKRLELGMYEDIPHLLTPVLVDPKQAANALRWAVREMEERYKTLAEAGVRNIEQYNRNVLQAIAEKRPPKDGEYAKPLPFIIALIDEFADLMMVAGNEVEMSIVRLAQMARAVGIHLILATQRPSVDVITGLIKANLPSRISFRVSSKIDSRTILDSDGAERLLGKGDMLFLPPASSRCIRLHGPYISEEECARLASFLREQGKPTYDETVTAEGRGPFEGIELDKDDLYDEAARLVVQSGQAAVSYLQRRLRIGFSRAARLVDSMEAEGLVSAAAAGKPREVLVPKTYFDE